MRREWTTILLRFPYRCCLAAVITISSALMTGAVRSQERQAAPGSRPGVDVRTARAATLDVRDFGAKGDGKADDTAAGQAAIGPARRAGGTLISPPGTYLVTSVGLHAGVRYSGYGATIRRPPRQGKFARTLDPAQI